MLGGNELVGKVALVTGASKGIGAGIATAFGHADANVAVGYARDEQADLANTTDIEAMVATTVATFGPHDTLVNNDGVFDYKALANIDETHFHHSSGSPVIACRVHVRDSSNGLL